MIRTSLIGLFLFSALTVNLVGCGSGDVSVSKSGAKLTSLSITPADPSLAQNTGMQFTATGIYEDNTTKDLTDSVTWSTSDPSVVTVANISNALMASSSASSTTKSGHAYAKGVGKTTVQASTGDTSGTTTVTVTPATLLSLAITPANPSIAKGTNQQLTAVGTFSDNTTQDLTSTVIWTSSGASIASITSSGLASALAAGSTTITASSGTVSGSMTLIVTPAVLVSLSVTPVNPSIAKGTSQQFIATGIFSDNSTQNLTEAVLWSVSDGSVAEISNTSGMQGLTTATAVGSVAISASSGGIMGSTTLTVTPATLLSISLTPNSPSIAKGTKQQFTATGSYTDGTTQNLTTVVAWSSSDTTVATISNAAGSYGLATSAATGNAKITAASGSVSGSATLTVTAAALVSVNVTPANPSIAKGTKQQFTATGTYTDSSTQNLTGAATWSSSNTSAATISNAAGSNGLATSVAAGTTTITAMSGNISGSATLTVTPAVLTALAVSPANTSISVNANQQFTVTGTYSDSTTQNLTATATWSSSNTTVAQISNAAGSQGLATGIAAGTTMITAISGGFSGTATLSVTSAAGTGAGSVSLAWYAPTEHIDGSPLIDLSGYRLYVGSSQRTYTQVFDIGNTSTYTLSNLAAGTYYIAVTVYTSTGAESDYSNEIFTTIL